MYFSNFHFSHLEAVTPGELKEWCVELPESFILFKQHDFSPLSVVEFKKAAKDYPIAFKQESAGWLPVALLSARHGKNTFLDQHGQWQENTYIPAAIRAYPFVMAYPPDSNKKLFCVDKLPILWNTEGRGHKLFDRRGKPTAYLQRAKQFLDSLETHQNLTDQLVEELTALDLLDTLDYEFKLPTGEQGSLQVYATINPDKLKRLTDAQAGKLNRLGLLEYAYLQTYSLTNMPTLIEKTRRTR